jgi:PepSY-associated TM region
MTAVLQLTLRACSKVSVGLMLKTWHRAAGLFAAVFLLLLTVTGLLLMHTDDLDLDRRHVGADRLLDWYGIHPAPPPLSFAVDDHWITQVGDRLYFDTRFVSRVDGLLIGALPAGSEILAATTGSLLLLTVEGSIAEKLGATAGVPSDLSHLGTTADGAIVVRSAHAQFVFDPLAGSIQTDAERRPTRWCDAAPAPAAMQRSINHGYRGSGLSLERIILDLHTGRLFGAAGVLLINLSSILLLILVFSGVVLWWRRARGNGSNGTGG